jgi:hypothetical protein
VELRVPAGDQLLCLDEGFLHCEPV